MSNNLIMTRAGKSKIRSEQESLNDKLISSEDMLINKNKTDFENNYNKNKNIIKKIRKIIIALDDTLENSVSNIDLINIYIKELNNIIKTGEKSNNMDSDAILKSPMSQRNRVSKIVEITDNDNNGMSGFKPFPYNEVQQSLPDIGSAIDLLNNDPAPTPYITMSTIDTSESYPLYDDKLFTIYRGTRKNKQLWNKWKEHSKK